MQIIRQKHFYRFNVAQQSTYIPSGMVNKYRSTGSQLDN